MFRQGGEAVYNGALVREVVEFIVPLLLMIANMVPMGPADTPKQGPQEAFKLFYFERSLP